jgi:hypothetical protein
MMHGSLVSEGSSVFESHAIVPMLGHAWNPIEQLIPHVGVVPVHVAIPFVGTAHTVLHPPQWFTSVGA